MDAAKEGDNATGIDNMKAAMQEATGTDNGGDKKIVLVCYSGNRYAQAATNILGSPRREHGQRDHPRGRHEGLDGRYRAVSDDRVAPCSSRRTRMSGPPRPALG